MNLPLIVWLLAGTLLLAAWPYVLYPLVLLVVAPRKRTVKPAVDADLPRAAMVICALNEAGVIGRKVENCLALRYPEEKLRFVFVNDGSDDGTGAILDGFSGGRVHVIHRERRRGKVSNLNQVVPGLDEPVVILSDANVFYDPEALRHLLRPLIEDPGIGCCSGRVILVNTSTEFQKSEQDYYSLEWKLQDAGSRLYSMCGADGAMYAFRRELFTACPDDTLIEDFVMPMRITAQGKRVIFVPEAVAWEEGPQTLREEFKRKVRIAAGAAQAIRRGNGLPGPAPLRFWFIFVSHKLLRWMTPVLGIAALVLALAGWQHWLSRGVLGGALALAALAAVRLFTGSRLVIFQAPFYFLFAQACVLAGLWKGFLGTQSVLWAKASR